MATITYRRISSDETRIYEDGKIVGDVTRQEDVVNPGSFCYIVHLSEDPRGFHRVPFGVSIDATVNLALETHPLFS